jgi:hypothetical protein
MCASAVLARSLSTFALCILSCTATLARAEVVRIEVKQVAPAFGGRTFGTVGAYERVDAIAHFRVDPNHVLNAGIVDIQYAPQEGDGHIAFDTDVIIFRPASREKASGVLVYEPVNRGGSLLLGTFNNAVGRDLNAADAAGDGWLMERGHSLVISGWQVDYPSQAPSQMSIALASRLVRAPGSTALAARLPIARNRDGSPLTRVTREQLLDVGPNSTFIANVTYPAADLKLPATLNVREKDEDPRATPSGLTWRWLDEWRIEVNKPASNPPSAGAIYEFIYTAKDPIVYGLGLASMRDLVSFMRYDASPRNPLALDGKSIIKTAIGFGASQTGRTMKELLYEFNEDERGRMLFEGVHINISGAGKNAVNSAFARPGQKDAQHGPSRLRGDEFPFSYAVTFDPLSRRTDGILARCSGTRTCPKVIHADSENEMWHGGALTFVDASGRDMPFPENVRAFVFAGTEHSASSQTAPPSCQVQPSAAIDWRPMSRALFAALEQWIAGIEPPASRYPRISKQELVTPDRTSVGFPAIPNVQYTGAVDARFLLDFSAEPPRAIARYPLLAPRLDTDGMMSAGVRHPFIEAPLATHTGWNLRREGMGAGELCMASGTRIPFAKTRIAREALNDPRLSIEERYRTEAEYESAVKRAADRLVNERLLLAEDAHSIVRQARERYRSFMSAH